MITLILGKQSKFVVSMVYENLIFLILYICPLGFYYLTRAAFCINKGQPIFF